MPEGRKYKKSGKKVEEMDLLEQMEAYHPFNEQEEMKNMLNGESLLFCFVSKCIPFQSKYIRKGRRESPIFAM